MARIRSIKPEAFTSETLAQVSIEARWTFAGLWTYVDDDGRGRYNTQLIRAAVYPLDPEMTGDRIGEHLARLEAVGLVCRYIEQGREYVHVVNFREHQHPNKPTPSRLPECSRTHTQSCGSPPATPPAVPLEDYGSPTGALPVGVVEEGKGVEGKSAQAPPPSTRRGTRLAPDWKPDGSDLEHAVAAGISGEDLRRETDKFRDYWTAIPGAKGVKLDWHATWRNWLRNANRYSSRSSADSEAATLSAIFNGTG